ncbi:hypothetical protein F3Y22_tig00000340pilonHSYRG01502 [Hibiscus syriacus]|uniref:Uncharacterized protein n=1 Tax=Hibiscus syriacus TaxID=106335 RepID=A0A6A3D2C0_HIBSY|nr:hypothetical protein F3Y22_tig00000340pilonHSYRG01502 [Hibiscus syriacus]
MKLVTPAKGTIELSKEKDLELFYLARCGLGGLGGDIHELYKESIKKYRAREITPPDSNEPDINEFSFTELRDKLLSLDPLNEDHVVKVNHAEAEFWRKPEGYRVGWSDEILGFDCGGQRWVSETCFPAGTTF